MIRVYLDWNVFSRLNDNTDTDKRLAEILSNDSKYLIPYSHAHIMDIYRGYVKNGYDSINGHLEKIQKYSESLFLTYTRIDGLEYNFIESKEAMRKCVDEDPVDERFNLKAYNPFKQLELLKPLLDFQIPNIPKTSDDNYKGPKKENPNTVKYIDNFFGTDNMTSVGIFLDNIHKLSINISEDDSFAQMRKDYQRDAPVSSGRFGNVKFDPLEILNTAAANQGYHDFLHFHKILFEKHYDQSVFQEIVALCNVLDFHGFGKENIKQGHHLDNIDTDYQHIAFASTCDIFVVEDKNAREKAVMVFKLLKINVKVFNKNDFVKYVDNNEATITSGADFVDYLFWVPNSKPTLVQDDLEYNYLNSYILDYFNVVVNPVNDPKHIILMKNGSFNSVGVLKNELFKVHDKLLELYGEPFEEINNIGNTSYAANWDYDNKILIQFRFEKQSIILVVKAK